VGFGHIYVDAEQAAVIAAIDRHLRGAGFAKIDMSRVEHPSRIQEIHETRTRLYWVAPRIGPWTGLFEWRYYNNARRERWGYTDEKLAIALSRDLKADAFRLEIIDQAGFWLYAHYREGGEIDGSAYHDTPENRSLDPDHPRYALNRIIDREKFANVGLGYENIPGEVVEAVDNIPQSAKGIEGLGGFIHLAYRHPDPPPLTEE